MSFFIPLALKSAHRPLRHPGNQLTMASVISKLYIALLPFVSNIFCRSSQAKIFPTDSEPPEDTVELWTGMRQPQDMGEEGGSTSLIEKMRCLLDQSKNNATPKLETILSALICLKTGSCPSRKAKEKQKSVEEFKCYNLECYNECQNEIDSDDCFTRKCMPPLLPPDGAAGGSMEGENSQKGKDYNLMEMFMERLHTAQSKAKRGSKFLETALQRLNADPEELRFLGKDLDLENLERWHDMMGKRLAGHSGKDSKQHGVVPRSEALDKTRKMMQKMGRRGSNQNRKWNSQREVEKRRRYSAMEKRYRLGLYDCISSYCSELSGADRKSCIINYCHRSTTFKV